MAVLPTRILEIEFDAGVWTDVTADMVEISTRRGRNRESGAFETGTCTFVLRNENRTYDPDHATGPYYGKLRPNRRVRLRATWSAVTYPVFVGYIDRIAQIAGGPHDGAAEFQASDLFKILNRVELARSVYEVAVAGDTPRSWFHLDEPAGSAKVYDAMAGVAADVVGAATLGASGLITRDPGSAMSTPSDAAAAVRAGISLPILNTAVPTGTADFSVEFTIATTRAAAGANIPILVQGEGSLEAFSIGLIEPLSPPYTRLFIQVASWHGGAVTYGNQTPTIVMNDGTAHHVVVTRTSGVGRIYVDGALAGGTFTLASDLKGDLFFGSPGTNVAFDPSLPNATLDELAFYNTALAAADVLDHYNGRRVGGQWAGDLPGTRLGRIFDLAGVPAGDRNLDAGTTTLQSTDLGGVALGYAQKVEETESGALFVARDGKVTFIGRDTLQTAYQTSVATLVDDDSGAGVPFRSGDADVDESRLVTRSTASREGSVAVTVVDQTAVTEFGLIDETHEGLLHDNDAYSRRYAEWVLNTHKSPTSRVGTVALELTRDPTNYPAVLGLELADRVTYKRKPQGTGAVTTIDMRVEAVSHATGPGHYWRTSLQLTPFDLAGGLPVFIWDVTRWDQHVWGI